MDAHKVKVGQLDELKFYDKYGHLRPGTYNVLSPTYSTNPKKYLWPVISGSQGFYTQKKLNPKIFRKLRQSLNDNGIKIDENELWAFIKNSIEGRELSKFYFTRLLSYVLDKIKVCSENIGVSASEVCSLPISSVIELLNGTYIDELDAEQVYLRARANKNRYRLQKSFSMPDTITNPDDIIFYKQANAKANFIGSTQVQGKCLQLESEPNEGLKGKIVCIPHADPGFDWIFGQKILGLVTEYGGSNSHMAIRCAELSITAAIGVGAENYNKIIHSEIIEIDPVNQKVVFIR
jgi:phosphohistidine swiveling domain-containing protein